MYDELANLGCKLIVSFEKGLDFIRNELRSDPAPLPLDLPPLRLDLARLPLDPPQSPPSVIMSGRTLAVTPETNPETHPICPRKRALPS